MHNLTLFNNTKIDKHPKQSIIFLIKTYKLNLLRHQGSLNPFELNLQSHHPINQYSKKLIRAHTMLLIMLCGNEATVYERHHTL